MPFNSRHVNPEFHHPTDLSGESFLLRANSGSLNFEELRITSEQEKKYMRDRFAHLAYRTEPLRIVVFGALGHWVDRSGAHAFNFMRELYPNLKLEIIAVNRREDYSEVASESTKCNPDGSLQGLSALQRFESMADGHGLNPKLYFNNDEFFKWAQETDEPIHGIYIAVPPAYHFPVLKDCLAVCPKTGTQPLVCVEKPFLVPSHYSDYASIPEHDRQRVMAMDHFPFSSAAEFVRSAAGQMREFRDALDIIGRATRISSGANEQTLVDLSRLGLMLRINGSDSALDAGIALDLLPHANSIVQSFIPDKFRPMQPDHAIASGLGVRGLALPETKGAFWQYSDPRFAVVPHEESGALITYSLCAADREKVEIAIQGQKGGPYDSHFVVASSEGGEVVVELGQRSSESQFGRHPLVIMHDAHKHSGVNTLVYEFPLQRKGRYGYALADFLSRAAKLSDTGAPLSERERIVDANLETQRWQVTAAGLVARAKSEWVGIHGEGNFYKTGINEFHPEALKQPLLFD